VNSTLTPKLPYSLRKKLHSYRRRRRALNVEGGLLRTLAVLIICVGAAVALDRWLHLGSLPRMIFLGLTAGAAAVLLLTRVLRPALRKMTDRRAAAGLGARFPKMKEDLVSAVELNRIQDAEHGVSRSLIASVIRRVAARAARIDYRAAVPVRPLLKAAAVALIVAALFEAAYLSRPEAIQNALHRLFRPDKPVSFFSYTKLNVEPGDHVIRTGDACEVLIRTSGRRATAARLEARNVSGKFTRKLPCKEGKATWCSAPLFEDLTYRVRARDATSSWYRVRVVPAPALRERSAILRDPDYAGGGERTVESIRGTLVVVEGSALQLRAEPVDRGADARFRCEGELICPAAGGHAPRLPMRLENGLLCSPVFAPAESGEYLIELADGYGLRNRLPESVFVELVPDKVPRVKIKAPGRDLPALRGEEIEVEVEAEDEFGLRGLDLTYRVAMSRDRATSKRWLRRPLSEGGIEVRRLAGKTNLNLSELGLGPGDVLEYRAEAADYADMAELRPGYSRVYRITLISETEHLEQILGRLRDVRIELLRKARDQGAEAVKAGDLAETARDAPVNDEARQARDREQILARKTENIAEDVESLLPELVRNPSTSAELLSEMEKLARAIRSVAADPMTSAAGKMGEAAETGADDPDRARRQAALMKQAQQSGREAAKELRRLAAQAARIQRSGVLGNLAARAEQLAARQRELKDSTAKVGIKTLGADPEELSEELKEALERLAAAEDAINSGVKALSRDIEEAAAKLSYTSPAEADAAERAGEKLRDDKVAEMTRSLIASMKANVLFSKLPKQEKVAASLEEAAQILRSSADYEEVDAIAKELEEFIRRQAEVNAGIRSAIDKDAEDLDPLGLPDKQKNLERDVSDQANALRWLAREIRLFETETADKLDAASAEMRSGARRLYRSELPAGLDHGEKALALLKDAREKFDEEREQMSSACRGCASLRAILLLQRILVGQRRLIRATTSADRMNRKRLEAFNRWVAALAGRQSALRLDALRLKKMLARFAAAAEVVDKSAGKMKISRMALEGGDTGKETRVVQRQAAALLEKLLGAQKNQLGGMGLAGARALAMMQMMQQIGISPGGYSGGSNAPILPATVRHADDESWRKVRSRFEGQLGFDFEPVYPPGFRYLLESYFEGLRNEPMR